MDYKKSIRLGGIKTGHVQGIATDKDRKYMYYSFTTCLVKTDMKGNIIGSVKGLAGHLGCIAYNYDDGKVYGSLEYKHDSIGTDILKKINEEASQETDVSDGFYAAVFDVEKIDRTDMDAERDGIMTAVYLREVVSDYTADGHRYGCSGIDGLTFAPAPGERGKKYLYVGYGIYSDTEREDNNYQVILRYDISDWGAYEKALNQQNMHRFGPEKPAGKYFVYTGNTTYGVQNLEYDEKTGYIFAAVYQGVKEKFPNYPMFVFDLNRAAKYTNLTDIGENGEVIELAPVGTVDEKTGISGYTFPYGATGIISLGDGYFYFSRDFFENDAWGTDIGLYLFEAEKGFTEVK